MSNLPQSPVYRCVLALVATIPGAGIDDPKPRLSPPLTESEAIKLKQCFLRDIASNIAEIADAGSAEAIAVFAPARSESVLRGLVSQNFKLFPQRGDTLGQILSNAVEDLLNRGFPAVCLVNSDCPTVPQSFLKVAVDSLGRPGDLLMLGSVDGGGYSLVGLKTAHQELFERVTSNASDVAAHTSTHAASIGLRVEMVPTWYDVHDARTLDRLCVALFGSERNDRAYPAPFTRQYLGTLLEREGPGRISPSLARQRVE
jgi:glycosyltransferase A (GT-A) superfamily protein (DUF2064 family)